MKRLNKTHIFHIFFGLLMFLPFISILSRVIYVQSNKNAKDSYSGNYEITYRYESNQITNEDDLIIGNVYQLNTHNSSINEMLYEDKWFYFELLTDLELQDSISIDETFVDISKFSNSTIMSFYRGVNDISLINLYSSMYDLEYNDYYISFIYNGFFDSNITIKLIDVNTNTFLDIAYIQYTDYNEIESVNLTGTLDNVFDYSISKFIEDNNFRINFFSWFEDLFLIQNGGVNALYLSFANWYMCYALLVSTGYLLFLILMWFINYVRKILEGGNSFGHGGF